ncbi:MAG TPA: HD domain-containing protein [Amycolatopsis sp.]|nr:HD domain-containing protein [Amycolatopsis sp.]
MDVASARELSQHYLAHALPQRWAHVRATARTAARIGPRILPAGERDLLVAAAFLHDIGYAAPLVVSGFHPLDSARFLLREGAPMRLCALVANHSAAAAVARLRGLGDQLAEFPDEASNLRDSLWYCDMSVGATGRPTTFDRRIADIRTRHGPDSFVVRALDAGGLDARAAACRRVRRQLVRRAPRVTHPVRTPANARERS